MPRNFATLGRQVGQIPQIIPINYTCQAMKLRALPKPLVRPDPDQSNPKALPIQYQGTKTMGIQCTGQVHSMNIPMSQRKGGEVNHLMPIQFPAAQARPWPWGCDILSQAGSNLRTADSTDKAMQVTPYQLLTEMQGA